MTSRTGIFENALFEDILASALILFLVNFSNIDRSHWQRSSAAVEFGNPSSEFLFPPPVEETLSEKRCHVISESAAFNSNAIKQLDKFMSVDVE